MPEPGSVPGHPSRTATAHPLWDWNAFIVLDPFVPAASLARTNRLPLPYPCDFPAKPRRAHPPGTSDGVIVTPQAPWQEGSGTVAQIVRPETILGWHRQLIARKFDGSKVRSAPGRTPTVRVMEELVLQMAQDNRTRGYRRIAGAMGNLGHVVSHQTVANLLKRHGQPRRRSSSGLPASARGRLRA